MIRKGNDAIESVELTNDLSTPEQEVAVEKQAQLIAEAEKKRLDERQRSKILAHYPELHIERSLSSRFTTMSDKTLLAFNRYFPWAVLKRSNPFKIMPFYMRNEGEINPGEIGMKGQTNVDKRECIKAKG